MEQGIEEFVAEISAKKAKEQGILDGDPKKVTEVSQKLQQDALLEPSGKTKKQELLEAQEEEYKKQDERDKKPKSETDKKEEATEKEEKRPRKKYSGILKEATTEEQVATEKPYTEQTVNKEIESKARKFDKIMSTPAFKMLAESLEKGEDFLKIVTENEKLNPSNLSDQQKYDLHLKRLGVEDSDYKEAMEDFNILSAVEKKEKVYGITKELSAEYQNKINSFKAPDIKEDIVLSPEERKRNALNDFNPIFSELKDKELYGIKMDANEISNFANQALGNFLEPDANGKVSAEVYLDAVFKLKNFDRIIKSVQEEAFNEGALFIKDQESFTGSNKPIVGNSGSTSSKQPEYGSKEYHSANAPGLNF